MAVAALFRSLLFSIHPSSSSSFPSSFSPFKRLFFTSLFSPSSSSPFKFQAPFSNPTIIIPKFRAKSTLNVTIRPFTTSKEDPRSPKSNTKVNFTPPEFESDSEPESESTQIKEVELPPHYDPFSKKPTIEEPEDPKNLQEIFHKMRTEGLINNAVKMFDEMSKDGLTHEALELFREIKDKGKMPDVVAHTAIIEAYANAGQSKEAHKVYLRMLASGVSPNAYTYSVLIKSLARDRKQLGEVRKYVLEMLEKGMRPNSGTCVAVFEAFVAENKAEEGREFLEEMKGRGFLVDEKGIKEVLKGKRGPLVRTVMDILFAK